MTTGVEKWDSIKQRYPDSFVLIENPTYDGATLTSGIFKYKNKIRKRVFEKAKELNLNHITILYSGGIRKERLKNAIFVL